MTKEFVPEMEDFTKELEEISEGQSRVYLVYAKYYYLLYYHTG